MIDQLAVLALSWPPHRPPPKGHDADAFLRYLHGLAGAVFDGQMPNTLPPQLPGQPRTAAATAALAAAVEEANRT